MKFEHACHDVAVRHVNHYAISFMNFKTKCKIFGLVLFIYLFILFFFFLGLAIFYVLLFIDNFSIIHIPAICGIVDVKCLL